MMIIDGVVVVIYVATINVSRIIAMSSIRVVCVNHLNLILIAPLRNPLKYCFNLRERACGKWGERRRKFC
jgi:hypothetical protein